MKTRMAMFMLVLAGVMSVVLTVHGMEEESQYDENYYDVIEAEYIDEIRTVLKEHSYFFAGITMTKITDEDGDRSYQVSINDRGFGELRMDEKTELLNELGEVRFADKNATIEHRLASEICE